MCLIRDLVVLIVRRDSRIESTLLVEHKLRVGDGQHLFPSHSSHIYWFNSNLKSRGLLGGFIFAIVLAVVLLSQCYLRMLLLGLAPAEMLP